MTDVMIKDELLRRNYAKCIVTRIGDYILPSFESIEEFSHADINQIRRAYAAKLVDNYIKGNPHLDPKGAPKPYMGKNLIDAIRAAQEYIIDSHLTLEKQRKQMEEAHAKAVEEEKRRNPVFTIGCLKTVVSLCELAGVDTVNLDKIFEVCDSFGIDINK